ncbi:hypothetical protein DSO57_1017583 [Entomophthora muscae]|uniref:Uncharacterized protein n=1 Tax=Entomophthora muscae TaxID=34485 RepID=A0ACC2UE71_9FUNG|nr:hypothetical protein DSO57_1017583 [Entomophthora muscae]
MGNLQEGFLPGTPMDIQEKVLKNKHLFKNVYGTLHQILPNGDTVPYVPSTQKINTILCYHRDLGHTCSRNLHEYLKTFYWWPNMLDDIREAVTVQQSLLSWIGSLKVKIPENWISRFNKRTEGKIGRVNLGDWVSQKWFD